jgi:hypothetical protein
MSASRYQREYEGALARTSKPSSVKLCARKWRHSSGSAGSMKCIARSEGSAP